MKKVNFNFLFLLSPENVTNLDPNKNIFSVSNESSKSKKNNNRNGQNRVRHELDSQGLVPLPAATCFYCRRSCKKAPLVACDYCPLLFHQVETTENTFSLCIYGLTSNCQCQNRTRCIQ